MSALEQLMKIAGQTQLDKLVQLLPLDKLAQFLPLEKLAGGATARFDELKNRERMSSVDTAWLRMDTPTNLMMIVGVMMFEGKLDLERLKRTITHRLLRYKRFRQRVVQDPTGAWWVDDEHFDIDNHIHLVNLPSPGGKIALEGLAAALATQSLDHNKPLWTMTVVENYEDGEVKGSAVITRIHHCIADGISLIGVMFSLTDEAADAPEEGTEPEALKRAREKKEARRAAASERDFLQSLYEPISGAAAKALSVSGNFAGKYLDVLSNPDKFADVAKLASEVTAEIAQLATMPNDSPTRFKGKPGAVKRVAWSAPLPLTDIKPVCKLLGVSINDILLSSAAGAMRSYLADLGDDTDGIEVRGFVPVNLRPRGAEHKLGNHFGLVALTLPVGIENPFVRLYEVKRRMDELKSSYQAALSMGILGTVGYLPRAVQRQVLDTFSNKGSAVMTNVPGPQAPLYMAGSLLKQQMFWVPQSGDIGMGVSILSYNGQVQFGLITDKKFVDQPARIVDRFAGEFDKLLYSLLLNGVPEEARQYQAPAEEALPSTVSKASPAKRPASGPDEPPGSSDGLSKPVAKASAPKPRKAVGKKRAAAKRKAAAATPAAVTGAAAFASRSAPAPRAVPKKLTLKALAQATNATNTTNAAATSPPAANDDSVDSTKSASAAARPAPAANVPAFKMKKRGILSGAA